MIVPALLSAIHVLTLALGAAALFTRGRALARPLDDAGWRLLLGSDNVWGLAAFLWITSGLGRVFLGGKEPEFYWRNGFFWIKIALFAFVFLLELTPMITLIGVRIARGRGAEPPRIPIERLRAINAAELLLLVGIVFSAAFMARGAWLF